MIQFYCPKCNDPVECDIAIGMGECFGCSFCFCTSCLNPFHGTSDCGITEETLREFKINELKISEKRRKELKNQRLIKLNEEKLSNSFISSTYKRCPGCQTNIEVMFETRQIFCK